MDLNNRIRQLIDSKDRNPNGFSVSEMVDSVISYTDCSDFLIKDSDIETGLKRLYQYANINELSEDKKCIITNSVNGNIARHLLENIYIYCFDNDYYCSQISQIVNEKKNKLDKIEYIFADISQFFTFKNNKNFTSDIVISCPSIKNKTYKSLDYEMKNRTLNPYQYYTMKSLDFVSKDGVVCSIIPTTEVGSVINQNYETPFNVLGFLNCTSGYTFIYLKKI